MSMLLVLVGAAILLVALIGLGLLVLVKLGVIAQYAHKQEPIDTGDYELDQSHEARDG
jgi:hypothetical protein